MMPKGSSLLTRLQLAEAQVETSPQDWMSWEALYVAWAQVGEVRAAGEALRRCTSLAPAAASIHGREARFFLGARDYQAALMAAEAHIGARTPSVELLELGLEVGLACQAQDIVISWAFELARLDSSKTTYAAHVLTRAGEFVGASDLLDRHLTQCTSRHLLARSDLRHHAQRDGLHRQVGVAPEGRVPLYGGLWLQGLQVDPNARQDGVDRTHAVGATGTS